MSIALGSASVVRYFSVIWKGISSPPLPEVPLVLSSDFIAVTSAASIPPFPQLGWPHYMTENLRNAFFAEQKSPMASRKTSPSLSHAIRYEERPLFVDKNKCLRQPGRPHQPYCMLTQVWERLLCWNNIACGSCDLLTKLITCQKIPGIQFW